MRIENMFAQHLDELGSGPATERRNRDYLHLMLASWAQQYADDHSTFTLEALVRLSEGIPEISGGSLRYLGYETTDSRGRPCRESARFHLAAESVSSEGFALRISTVFVDPLDIELPGDFTATDWAGVEKQLTGYIDRYFGR